MVKLVKPVTEKEIDKAFITAAKKHGKLFKALTAKDKYTDILIDSRELRSEERSLRELLVVEMVRVVKRCGTLIKVMMTGKKFADSLIDSSESSSTVNLSPISGKARVTPTKSEIQDRLQSKRDALSNEKVIEAQLHSVTKCINSVFDSEIKRATQLSKAAIENLGKKIQSFEPEREGLEQDLSSDRFIYLSDARRTRSSGDPVSGSGLNTLENRVASLLQRSQKTHQVLRSLQTNGRQKVESK